ncbi:MerR family transcriptional regulator [Anoxybacterium hadale]|uniref:MerR family transcriptional regulator n=1 Tax=Anoxybacterium hadale TaxID=3408580 RepID=A0ACD1A779_9FIRM|nr:MerR family transcriptional regulator [Clostridiales bacterium]
MEYTVQRLAALAGISGRTLRYYDEIGILKPARINSSGYRIYGKKEVETLQQILFYRELDVDLDTIKKILKSPGFDSADALRNHRSRLLEKREQLERLIENIDKSIATAEGRMTMSDKEKFEGFKKSLVENNDKKFGKEVREKYGEEAVMKSNQKVLNMSQEEYDKTVRLEEELRMTLASAMQLGDPGSEGAQKAANLHRKWLCLYWDQYSAEAHAGLANMYVEDERFRAYYDKEQPGTAEFLRDAILIYTSHSKKNTEL